MSPPALQESEMRSLEVHYEGELAELREGVAARQRALDSLVLQVGDWVRRVTSAPLGPALSTLHTVLWLAWPCRWV